MSDIQTWKTQTQSADAAARQAIATAAIAGDMAKVSAITAALKPLSSVLDSLITARRDWQQQINALDALTKAEQTKEPQTRLRITINWRTAGHDRPEMFIDEPQAATSLVRFIQTLIEVLGSDVLPRIQAIRVLKNALVSQTPLRDFMNPKQGEAYSHHRIGSTGWFVNTNTSTEHKAEQINEIKALLGLPPSSVHVEILKKQTVKS
ncbi:MAG: hypothetical protein J0L73_00740 [Verrucomicrobia bacterium]|nr:hypothetical protein [Verrucomicrobiota bacterium]